VNCNDVRDRLPAHLYGDLPPDETLAVQTHLLECADCRQEFTAMSGVWVALDAGPIPTVAVDLPRLYLAAADRQRRQARRWRRLALAGTALAAALLLAFGSKLEVRVDGQQVVVRWGRLPAEPPAVTLPPATEPAANVDERLRLLQELAHALAADVDSQDQRQRDELTRLRAQVESLRRQTDRRWAETARDVTALYTMQTRFPRPEKGAMP
jgi:anti-sigma factor RsiW